MSFRVPPMARLRASLAIAALAALGFGGCAQSPQQIAAASHSKEYFPSSVYGAASRRVVADGQPIPRGGGQYLVGKPYTVAGQKYFPSERKIVQVGNASWYGDAFHGRLTANGEIYDRDGFTAAHPTMPLPSYARVTNLRNNYSMIVRVNDRGPYASNRVMDVSRRVAESLDFKRSGTAKIKVEYVGRASLAGSDDQRLFATLRTNGPAQWQGEPTMVAEAQPPARVASLAPYAPAPRALVQERRPEPVAEAEGMEPRVLRERRAMPRPEIVREEVAHERVERRLASRDTVSRDRDDDRDRPVRRDARLATAAPHLPISALLPPERPDRSRSVRVAGSGRSMMPPSRPMDLGTIPGADSKIRAHRHDVGLRMARARDD